MSTNRIYSSTVLPVVDSTGLTLLKPASGSLHSNTTRPCSVSLNYIFLEHIVYLYLMSPLCLIGLLLNVISLIVFSDRSFKNLTFKYLRLIALVDCITCTLVFIYCVTNYTRPHSLNDKYFRMWYLVNVYFPLANITAACNVLLTITVTIERLVSVRWPMEKQRLFSPNRVIITLVVCFFFPILANSVNFRVYKMGDCHNVVVTPIARTKAYGYFGICKEILLRFIPICILIFSNCLLLSTVRAANQKFKPPKTISHQPSTSTSFPVSSNGCETMKSLVEATSQTDTFLAESPSTAAQRKSSIPLTSANKMHLRKQQQERQLTIMLVWISSLYLCGQIPMLFAYPNFVFKEVTKPPYKYYAVVVNVLELATYLANFFVYVKYTTQFQQVFRTKMKQICFCWRANS